MIEIDGNSHNDKPEYDEERNSFFESLGLIVIHIAAKDMLEHLENVMTFFNNHPSEEGNRFLK